MKIKKLILAKRISQALFFALFVYILMSTTYPLTGIISSQVLFKADPLVMLITSISERTIIPGIMWGLVMLFITVLIGRFFCGWVCPLGTLIDIAGAEKKAGY